MNEPFKKYLNVINYHTFPLIFSPRLRNLFPLSHGREYLFTDVKYYSFVLAKGIKIKVLFSCR